MSEYEALSVATLRSGVQVQQRVKDVQGVARGARHDRLPDALDLVIHGVGPGRNLAGVSGW